MTILKPWYIKYYQNEIYLIQIYCLVYLYLLFKIIIELEILCIFLLTYTCWYAWKTESIIWGSRNNWSFIKAKMITKNQNNQPPNINNHQIEIATVVRDVEECIIKAWRAFVMLHIYKDPEYTETQQSSLYLT